MSEMKGINFRGALVPKVWKDPLTLSATGERNPAIADGIDSRGVKEMVNPVVMDGRLIRTTLSRRNLVSLTPLPVLR